MQLFQCTSQGQQNSIHHQKEKPCISRVYLTNSAIGGFYFLAINVLQRPKKKTKSQIKREDWKRWRSGQRYPEVNFIFTRKTQAPTGRLLTDKSLNRLFTIYSRPPNRPQDKPFVSFLCLGPWLSSQIKGFICSFYLTQVRSLPYLAIAPFLCWILFELD